ncbi:uncharacterized protein [Amphiura filiformis]|uniref:uncharacterized protein n=1 Tax=Amphiura filiformis TaxID=82378 RepID=UPI003B2208CC
MLKGSSVMDGCCKYLLVVLYLISGYSYTANGSVCFVTRMTDPNEGGRLRWAVPINQRWTCTRVFASPVGKHMMHPPAPTKECCIGHCSEVQMWFEDDIPSFLHLTISDEITSTMESFSTMSTTSTRPTALTTSGQLLTTSTQPVTVSTMASSYVAPDTNLTASNDNSGHSYIGCFQDGDPLMFPASNLVSNPTMTREVCFGHCQSRNMKYATVHWIFCSCGPDGHNFNIYGQVADDKCYYRCPGNYEQYCGGVENLFTLFASVFEIINDCGSPIPTTWTYSNGSCYKEAYTDIFVRHTWDSAQLACTALTLGGHLVVINSKEENDFIRGFGLTPLNEAIWLGCSDTLIDGQWACLDGSGSTYDLTTSTGTGFWAWNDLDPVFSTTENCLIMDAFLNGGRIWYDIACTLTAYIQVICEVEVSGSCCPP